MIENCITKETKFFEFNCESLIEFNTNDIDKFNSIAKKISEETGVPKDLIYQAPHFFYINRWHKINGEWYFYKNDGYDFHFVNELLGEIISEYFGLETVKYQVAKFQIGNKKEYGLISKNFCNKDYTYKRVWDYGFPQSDNLNILENIRDICQSNEEYLILLDDLKKFFIRDFYTSQLDRSGNNFLFKVMPSGIRLAPLYDYENAFESIQLQIYRNQIATINIANKETQNILKNDEKLQQLLYYIMKIDIVNLINEMENRHKILVPLDMKEYYQNHDSEIKSLILKNNLII